MKANELRIGSIVKSLVNDEEFSIVEDIGHRASLGHYVSLNNQHSGVWLVHQERELILGIPLTEEWLIKFGFTLYNKENPIMFKGVVFIEQRQKTLIGTQFFTFCFDGNTIKIKYVHQLQNLYFVLTGEELTMK